MHLCCLRFRHSLRLLLLRKRISFLSWFSTVFPFSFLRFFSAIKCNYVQVKYSAALGNNNSSPSSPQPLRASVGEMAVSAAIGAARQTKKVNEARIIVHFMFIYFPMRSFVRQIDFSGYLYRVFVLCVVAYCSLLQTQHEGSLMVMRKENEWKKYYFVFSNNTLAYSKAKGVSKTHRFVSFLLVLLFLLFSFLILSFIPLSFLALLTPSFSMLQKKSTPVDLKLCTVQDTLVSYKDHPYAFDLQTPTRYGHKESDRRRKERVGKGRKRVENDQEQH